MQCISRQSWRLWGRRQSQRSWLKTAWSCNIVFKTLWQTMTLLPRMCACTHACMHTHKHTHTHTHTLKKHTGYWTSAPIRSPICRCLKICQAKNNTIIKQYARFENRVICISSAQLTESNTPNNDSCGHNTCTVEKKRRAKQSANACTHSLDLDIETLAFASPEHRTTM